MILFHYIPGNSILHRINPGIKLIILLGYSILIFQLSLPVLFVILLAEVLLIFMAKIGIKQILKELKRFFLFMLIIFILRAYSSNGLTIVVKVIPLPSLHGLLAGGYVVLRLCMVIFLGLLFTSTTKINHLQNVLYSFFSRIPFFPAARIATLMSLTIGSFPLLLDKLQEVDEARKARCIQSNRNPVYQILSFTLPLFIHILKRADDITCAMEARCYTENLKPFSEPLQKKDYIIFIMSIAAGCITLVLNYFLPVIL